MKYIKIISLITLLIVILGCSNNPVKKEDGSIDLWYGWNGSEEKQLISSLKEYGESKNIKINFRRIPFDGLQKEYQNKSKNGNGPDLIIGPSDWIGVFKNQDLIEEITEYLPADIQNEFLKTAWDGCINDNKVYALPESIKLAALYYNKDIIKTAPKDTDEMIKISKDLMNSEKAKYGLVYDFGNYYYHAGWVGGFGESILDKNFNPTFNSSGQINAIKFVKSIKTGENKIMPDLVDYNVMMTLFVDKECPMIITGPWAMPDFIASGVNVGVGDIPVVSSTGLKPKPFVGIEGMMLSKSSINKDKGIEIIKYFASDDFQAKMAIIGHIPSRNSTYLRKDIKESPYFDVMNGFRHQAESGYTLPTNVEMSLGIWANGASFIENVLTDRMSAEDAGKKYQNKAMKSIEEYRVRRKQK